MTGSGYRSGSKRQMLAVETPTQRHLINTRHWLLSYAVTAPVRLMTTQIERTDERMALYEMAREITTGILLP